MKRYSYKPTKEIGELLKRIERVRILVEELPVSMELEENLRRKSLLKSSLFSARIEGNRLRLRDVRPSVGTRHGVFLQDREQLEVANVLSSLRWIRSRRSPRRLSMKVLRGLHARVLKGLSGDAGKLRTQPSAIFNSAGHAVRLNPSPQNVKELLSEWLAWVKELVKSEPIPVAAALAHLGFEKIHPFVDGNGRVGRLVSQFILDRGDYGFKGLISFEEYLSKYRQEYYDLLALDKSDATDFVTFFLEAVAESGEKVVRRLKRKKKSALQSIEDSLLPRRREILEIIRDHKTVSFDFLCRRFGKVNQHTLRYDLRQLMKGKLVRKLGGTRGALYAAR